MMSFPDKLRALVSNWYDRADATQMMCPDLKELRPTTQLLLLSKAQRICGQELENLIDREDPASV